MYINTLRGSVVISVGLPASRVSELLTLVKDPDFEEFKIVDISLDALLPIDENSYRGDVKQEENLDDSETSPIPTSFSPHVYDTPSENQQDERISLIRDHLNTKREFPTILKKFMNRKKLHLEDLADGTAVKTQTVSNWISGKQLPLDAEKIFLIGHSLGLSSKEHNRMLKAWMNDRDISLHLDYLEIAVAHGAIDKALEQFTNLLKISLNHSDYGAT